MNKDHHFDLLRIMAVWIAIFLSIPWGPIAQFLACVATFLTILKILGLLAQIKGFWGRVFARVWDKVRPDGPQKPA